MAQVDQELQAVAAANACFSRKFYKALQKHEGNLAASPLSAQLVLVMAQLGARGATAEEMRSGLSLPDDAAVVKKGFNSLMTTLKSSDKVTMEIANRLYLKTGFEVNPEFVSALQQAFESTVESVNFVDPAVRHQINNWVEKSTHDKIKDLIPDGVLDALTRLVLVNAVYFKGPWLSPFNPARTRPMPFYTDETNSIETPFMYQKTHYGYGRIDKLDAEIVEMPYEGRQLSLVIILPKSRTGLADLETKMQDEDLSALMGNVHNREIELYIPKFKLEVSLQLNDYLKDMGMKSMFSDSADFSGISKEFLKVSHVIQKTFIEVSEEGTEAAAATALIMCRRGMLMPEENTILTLDHPFIFYLVKREVNTAKRPVLFSGRLLEP